MSARNRSGPGSIAVAITGPRQYKGLSAFLAQNSAALAPPKVNVDVPLPLVHVSV